MRVTTSLMSKSYLRNLSRQTNKVQKYQEQLSSLKEVNRPSDDPLTVSKILDLNNSITQNVGYLTTIDEAIDWTNVQDAALDQASNSLGRIRTLIQSAANGTMSPEDRKAIKNDVEGEIGGFVDALNTSIGGRYVFAGKNTTDKPFEFDFKERKLTYQGSKGKENHNLAREVAPGVTVDLLTDGNRLTNFGDSSKEEIGKFFKDVLSVLDAEVETDIADLGGTLLAQADEAFENVVEMRVNIGATFNRLESAKSRNETENLNLKSILSSKEDVDLAEKYMEYSMEMIAFEATLQIGTRVLQTNILNFL